MQREEIERVRIRLSTGYLFNHMACPVSNPASERALLYQVPVGSRGFLGIMVEERAALNYATSPHYPYVDVARLLKQAESDLILGLRQDKKLPPEAIIEFHADWMFSVTTLETIRADFDSRKKPVPPQEATDSGLCYEYQKRPKEMAHIRFMPVDTGKPRS